MKIRNLILGPSWLTSVVGAVAGIPIVLMEVQAHFDGNPETVLDPARLGAGVGVMLGLRLARDGNKSSQDHHIR